MAQENLEQFWHMVAQDQELQEKLKAANDREAFVKRSVELGEGKGYSFTTEEVETAVSVANKRRELNELWEEIEEKELETVSGGLVCCASRGNYNTKLSVKNSPSGLSPGLGKAVVGIQCMR